MKDRRQDMTKATTDAHAGARRTATLTMKAALDFSEAAAGKAIRQARRAFGALGAFGAAIVALYPVAVVVAIVLAGLMLTGPAATI